MKLNLGSGNIRFQDFTNVDRVKLPNVDIVHDLDVMPYPFPDGSVDEIRMSHCLEHLENPIKAIGEIYRMLKPRGVLTLRLPYPGHPVAHNMWHKQGFQAKDFYALDKDHNAHYFLDKIIDVDFRVKKIKYIPNIPPALFPFWFLERFLLLLANENPRVYEAYWSQLFPASEYEIILVKK